MPPPRSSGPRPVALGLVQMAMTEDVAENVATAERYVREAAAQGAQVVCLPELFAGPYFCKTEDHAMFGYAEAVPGPTTDRFEALAKELGVAVLVSLFEKRAEGLYHNTLAVVHADGGYLGKYRKMHIPDDPLFYEKFYFTPGDLGFKVFDVGALRAGTLVCWDQWYPEAARLTAMQGADVLFYPTAIGWLPEERAAFGAAQHDAWELVQRSHAVTNGCFVVSVNRTGFEATPGGATDEGIQFWGQSFVAGPDGQIVHRMGADEQGVAVVTVDLARLDEQRTVWPFLRDRRIDAYSPLTRRYLDES